MSSLFGRLLNWILPSLGVQDDQLRPDPSYVDRVLSAAYDIRLCKDIFNGWATHLDKCVQRHSIRIFAFSSSRTSNTMCLFFCSVRAEKPDEREREVRQYLAWLSESARKCSKSTDMILRCQADFACLMAWQIDGAAKGLDCGTGSDTRRLADLIAEASRSLSQNIVKLKNDLDSFVFYLEKMQVKEEEEEKSIAHQILGWLKLFFNVLAGIFAIGSFLAPLLHPVAPAVDLIAPAASALSIAAVELCDRVAGTSLGMPVRTNE